MIKKAICVLTAMLLLALATSPLILASTIDMPYPDTTPSIIKVFAYENCVALGDQCFIAQIKLPYATAPSTPTTAAYVGRMLDNTGTEVGSTLINSYYNGGYGYNTLSLYFPTSVVPWNTSTVYSLVLNGISGLNWLGTTAATAMSGAITSAGVDETTAANNATIDDMTLPDGSLNSTYYFGSTYDFDKLTINISTPGVGAWAIVWEYWNGNGWSPLLNVVDNTSYFMAPAGNHDVTFTIPTDWTTSVLAPVATSQMWIRARVSSSTSITTAPLGAQSWVNGNSTAPTVTMLSSNFIWNTSTAISTTQNLMYGQTITWADTLGSYWSLPLTTMAGSTKVLSSYGQTYFPMAIPGLQQMCPRLFATTVSKPQYVDKPVNTDAATAAVNSWPLDWTGIAHWLGFTGTDTAFRGLICLIGILFITTLVTTKSANAAVPVAFALLIGFSAIGWVTPVLAAGIAFAAVVVFGLVFLLGKPIS